MRVDIMSNAVKLQDLIEEMDMQSEESKAYLDTETMNIVSVLYGDIYGADDINDPDEFDELCGERFIPLPNRYNINEYQIMEDFIETLPENVQGVFYAAINGRGAFRRFKDVIINKDVEDQWYKFKEQAFKQIAVEWCRDNDIEYEE